MTPTLRRPKGPNHARTADYQRISPFSLFCAVTLMGISKVRPRGDGGRSTSGCWWGGPGGREEQGGRWTSVRWPCALGRRGPAETERSRTSCQLLADLILGHCVALFLLLILPSQRNLVPVVDIITSLPFLVHLFSREGPPPPPPRSEFGCDLVPPFSPTEQ